MIVAPGSWILDDTAVFCVGIDCCRSAPETMAAPSDRRVRGSRGVTVIVLNSFGSFATTMDFEGGGLFNDDDDLAFNFFSGLEGLM
jgi:hypothetical protein